MNVRLRDVADHAGVSFKTVSNVINNHPHVSEQTRSKVQAAINALGYRPNLAARSLRYGRSGFIGLAIPELTSPYFATLASEISAAAKRHGRSLIIEETSGERDGEINTLTDFSSRLVDGMILSPLDLSPSDFADKVVSSPLVFLGEHHAPHHADQLVIDNIAAAADVTEHLLALGRRRLAVIGHQSEEGTGSQRWNGVRDTLRRHGLTPNPDLIASTSAYHRASGARAMAELIDSGAAFDAVICFNDLLALGAMHELQERGLGIPGDVAVTGFDDIEDARYVRPALTTVRPDVAFLAEEAMRLLNRRFKNPQADAERVTVPHQLVQRPSTVQS